MKAIKINVVREYYQASQAADHTITAGQLINLLKQYESDAPVILSNDNGYTYSIINDNRIWQSNLKK